MLIHSGEPGLEVDDNDDLFLIAPTASLAYFFVKESKKLACPALTVQIIALNIAFDHLKPNVFRQ